jgi:hypothetical protein
MPLLIQFWLQNFRMTFFFRQYRLGKRIFIKFIVTDISVRLCVCVCACVRACVCVCVGNFCYSALYLVLFCCWAVAPLFLLNFVYFAQKVYLFGQLFSGFLCINIPPVQSQYILSIILFVTKNKDQCISNSQVHTINTRQTSDMHIHIANFRHAHTYSKLQTCTYL